MGHYLKTNSKGEGLGNMYEDKVHALIMDGAVVIAKPAKFRENLVAVADNGSYAVAAYCYDEAEFRRMTLPDQTRPVTWLIYPHAENLPKEKYKIIGK